MPPLRCPPYHKTRTLIQREDTVVILGRGIIIEQNEEILWRTVGQMCLLEIREISLRQNEIVFSSVPHKNHSHSKKVSKKSQSLFQIPIP